MIRIEEEYPQISAQRCWIEKELLPTTHPIGKMQSSSSNCQALLPSFFFSNGIRVVGLEVLAQTAKSRVPSDQLNDSNGQGLCWQR